MKKMYVRSTLRVAVAARQRFERSAEIDEAHRSIFISSIASAPCLTSFEREIVDKSLTLIDNDFREGIGIDSAEDLFSSVKKRIKKSMSTLRVVPAEQELAPRFKRYEESLMRFPTIELFYKNLDSGNVNTWVKSTALIDDRCVVRWR